MINCLSYALRFWDKHPKYKIYYNSDHCINSDRELGNGWLEFHNYGLNHLQSSFRNLLMKNDVGLLMKYFNKKP